MTRELTRKEQRFVAEYTIDQNATQAAIRAGYSQRTARSIGSENLARPAIADAIAMATQAQSERLKRTADHVVREVERLAFSNILDYITPSEDGGVVVDLSALTRDQGAAIQDVTIEQFMDGKGADARPVRRIKFKLHDKKGPLEMLGRRFAAFPTRLEHSGPHGGPIKVEPEPSAVEVARRIAFVFAAADRALADGDDGNST
jgi:phage terminase small subunit